MLSLDGTRHATARLHLDFLVLVGLICATSFGLSAAFGWYSHPDPIDAGLVIENYQKFLAPKPKERFVFVVTATTFSFVAYLLSVYRCRRPIGPSVPALGLAIPPVIALAFLWSVIDFGFNKGLLYGAADLSAGQRSIWGISIVGAVGWCFVSAKPSSFGARARGHLIAWAVFIVAMLAQIFAWRVFSWHSIGQGPAWTADFDAGLYALSQVIGGRTLLSDLPSQYGLFPEILAPVFRGIGPSILKITIVFAAIQAISLIALFRVVDRHIRDFALRALFGLAIVMVTFETSIFIGGSPDRYFQYWPVRFVWPALSVWAFARYATRVTTRNAALFSIFAAIGTVWNSDSGLVVAVAFAVFLMAKMIVISVSQIEGRWEHARTKLWHLMIHNCILIAGVAVSLTYLRLKAGGPLRLSWLTDYQRVFYGLGLNSLPLPVVPSPWMAVLGVYLIGAMSAVSGWGRTQRSSRQDLIFFVSVLGLGLFFYYQYRPHVLNFVSICWPAIFLCALLADRLVRATRSGLLGATNFAFYIAALAILSVPAISLIRHAANMGGSAVEAFQTRRQADDLDFASELEFLRERTHRGEKCVIIAQRQASLYLESGLASPISGPGLVEMILVSDRDHFVNEVRSNKPACVFVGEGSSTAFDNIGKAAPSLFVGYRVSARSKSGTLVQLVPE
jgi:hypothetical protein